MVFADKLHDIINTLETDGVILHPTDTIWGLGCSVLSSTAIEKIYKIKDRPTNKPLILLVSSLKMLKKYVPRLHPRIETLLHYHKQPLTVIYKRVAHLPEWALAPDRSVAVRIVQDDYCQHIIDLLGTPLVSTSANLNTRPAPDSFSDVDPEIINSVDYVAKEGRDRKSEFGSSIIITYDEDGNISFIRA